MFFPRKDKTFLLPLQIPPKMVSIKITLSNPSIRAHSPHSLCRPFPVDLKDRWNPLPKHWEGATKTKNPKNHQQQHEKLIIASKTEGKSIQLLRVQEKGMIVSCRVRWAMQELCYMSIIRQTKVNLFKEIGNKCLFIENFHFFNLLSRWSISAQSKYYVVQTFYRTQNPAQLIATISSISILAHPAKNSLTQIDNAVALRARSAIICRRVGHRGVTGTKDRPSESVPAKNRAPPSQQSVKQMTVRARDTTQRFQRHSDELQIIPFNKHQFSNYQFCFHWRGDRFLKFGRSESPCWGSFTGDSSLGRTPLCSFICQELQMWNFHTSFI